MCGYEEIFKAIKSLNNNISNVVVVGHEPSMSETMRELVGTVRPGFKQLFNVSLHAKCTMSFIYFNKKGMGRTKKSDGLFRSLHFT